MISSSHSHDPFATTRWSVVMHAASAETGDANVALGELAQRYWYPVYAYVRRCGHEPPIARDISRCFLGDLLQNIREGGTCAPRGYFRRFLLERLRVFLGADWREIVDGNADAFAAPDDLESRFQQDSLVGSVAEEAYQRSFALEIIARARKRLRAEAQQTGHLKMYTALEGNLAREPAPGEYEQLAAHLSIRPLTLAVALKRLRQRFRELVGEELADTVTSADELVTEQQALRDVLHSLPTRS